MKLYRHYWLYFLISACFLVPGLISLCLNGLRPGIDFTGGSLLTLAPTEASTSGQLTETIIRDLAGDQFPLTSVTHNTNGETLLRLSPIDNEAKNQLLSLINQQIPVAQVSFDSVGGTLGQELIVKTLLAIALSSLALVLYLRYRFHDFAYGWAAFLGVVHDVLIICGIFSLLGWLFQVEVDTLFVTALLTTVSFSVHDTVVIYDRIRELQQQYPRHSLSAIATTAVSATFSRSLNNSLTVCFMLLSLLILGGVTLRAFALALLLGVVFGTYSSPFTCVPLLLLAHDKKWFQSKKHL